MVLIEAKLLDSTHLELSEPLPLKRGATVLVAVAESAEVDAVRNKGLDISAAALQRAYGESEPAYPATLVGEFNPDYRA